MISYLLFLRSFSKLHVFILQQGIFFFEFQNRLYIVLHNFLPLLIFFQKVDQKLLMTSY